MRYYIVSQLSQNRSRTPEGYLLCMGVPIARTGAMEYLPEEVPEQLAEHAKGKTILVYRMAADVFAAKTVASYEGKPVTIDHPDDFVTPDNWKDLAVGILMNVRPGAGKESDLLLADLLITDQEAIDLIESGELREVSCGYDADYEETATGVGKQTNIIGNHLALVSHGRCGSRCAIKDKEPEMAKKPSWWDRIMGNPKVKRAMDEAAAEEKAKDEAAPPEKKEGEQATDNDDAVGQLTARVEELTLLVRSFMEGAAGKAGDEDTVEDEDPDPAEDEDTVTDEDKAEAEDPGCEKKGTGDRAPRRRMADAETVRRANLLAPSLRAHAGYSDCVLKRAALRSGMRDSSIKKTVDACLRGASLDKADCITLDAAFIAASEIAGSRNNSRTADSLSRASTRDFGKAVTPADINRMNREFHDKKAGK